jgi:hypothetical protein
VGELDLEVDTSNAANTETRAGSTVQAYESAELGGIFRRSICSVFFQWLLRSRVRGDQ